MSRSGYSEDCDNDWDLIRWRGAVASAIRGKRGQEFLYEMLHALAALPFHELIDRDLEKEGRVCALGAVGKARGLDMSTVDPEDYDGVATLFGIPRALAQEIMWMNDEAFWRASPLERFRRMREWVESNLRTESASTHDVSGGTK